MMEPVGALGEIAVILAAPRKHGQLDAVTLARTDIWLQFSGRCPIVAQLGHPVKVLQSECIRQKRVGRHLGVGMQ